MISSEDFFEEISSDRLHGASHLYAKFLSLLGTYLQQLEKLSEDFVAGLGKSIVKVRSDMAPFYYAALRVSELAGKMGESPRPPREQLCDLVRQLREEQAEAISKIVEYAEPHLAGVKSIILHSNSATVTTAIKKLLDHETRVYLSDALPEREGEKLGEELAAHGLEVTLFPDDAKCWYVKSVDLVLLGSDWVAEDDFSNKVGSSCLSLAAFKESKPVLILADGSKLVPGELRPQSEINRVRLSKNLYREAPMFEEVDNQLVEAFVTDLGIFSASEIKAFVETRLKYVNFSVD